MLTVESSVAKMESVKTYGQFCAMAKALDLVGDRWTLLIVRELLIRGGCRYTDLRNGLPGIATNLLAERLKEMESMGLVRRGAPAPPVATPLFHLTSRGHELQDVVSALGRWGAPLLADSSKKDVFCSHWLSLPLTLYLRDVAPKRPRVALEIRAGSEPLVLETMGDGTVRARPGTAVEPDGVLTGPAPLILALLSGKLNLAEARAKGLRYDGNANVLRRLNKPSA